MLRWKTNVNPFNEICTVPNGSENCLDLAENTSPTSLGDLFLGGSMLGNFWNDFDKNSEHNFLPAVNLHETEKEYVVEIDLPGIDPKQVEVTLKENILHIKGERKQEEKTDTKSVFRHEIHYGTFGRNIRFPEGINPEHTEANFKNGVLEVRIAKREETKPRTIKVKTN